MSICVCGFCGSIDKNMVFNLNNEQWFCIDCDLHFKEISALRSKIPLNLPQIETFLINLSRRLDIGKKGSNCDGSFSYSKIILGEMDIDNETLNSFLHLCQEYGGYCDCEILFNVKNRLLSW